MMPHGNLILARPTAVATAHARVSGAGPLTPPHPLAVLLPTWHMCAASILAL